MSQFRFFAKSSNPRCPSHTMALTLDICVSGSVASACFQFSRVSRPCRMTGGAIHATDSSGQRMSIQNTVYQRHRMRLGVASASRMSGPVLGSVGHGCVRQKRSLALVMVRCIVRTLFSLSSALAFDEPMTWSRKRRRSGRFPRSRPRPRFFLRRRHVFLQALHCLLRSPKRTTRALQQRDFACIFSIHAKCALKYQNRLSTESLF